MRPWTPTRPAPAPEARSPTFASAGAPGLLNDSAGLALAGSISCLRRQPTRACPGLAREHCGGCTRNRTPPVHSAAFVGIAWAARQHAVCLQPAGCATREGRVWPHRPERLPPWAEGRRQRCHGESRAGCWEVAKGPLGLPGRTTRVWGCGPSTLRRWRRVAPPAASATPKPTRRMRHSPASGSGPIPTS
jgi:hypothetical protein